MRNLARWIAIALVILLGVQANAACTWPAWEQFKKDYISEEGRVIDSGDARKITTSEGQSYALFFALAANDRRTFAALFNWTQDNLAKGDLRARLPAWQWGETARHDWTVLDSNSAADADLWIAWSLLEAGRLWKMPQYSETGNALLARITREDVVKVPGLGLMLLPGKIGFVDKNRWRFNPSYLPPQLARYFTRFNPLWQTLRETNLRLLLETAPKGYAPDWVFYEKNTGWQLKQDKALVGSYDAIRVYLWVGMLHDDDPQKARLLARFNPMALQTTRQGLVPETANVATGNVTGNGPVGFSAALLPFLQHRDAQAVQRQRVADHFPGTNTYYSYVLTLFGQGWDQHRFRFTARGELLPDWGQACATSH